MRSNLCSVGDAQCTEVVVGLTDAIGRFESSHNELALFDKTYSPVMPKFRSLGTEAIELRTLGGKMRLSRKQQVATLPLVEALQQVFSHPDVRESLKNAAVNTTASIRDVWDGFHIRNVLSMLGDGPTPILLDVCIDAKECCNAIGFWR